MKVLILGGYGVFGGRLAELLTDIGDLDILICGRNYAKAHALCERLSGSATFTPAALDRANIASALERHTPDLVIDASGPFQNYGTAPYAVIDACLKHRVHYLDFADDADFVFGVSGFDARAKAAGCIILSGVSSFPVLTAAVLREMSKTMTVKHVSGGIAPSPYAGIGLNVMRAVVSYAGGPVKLRRAGKPFTAKGLTESRRYIVAPPGFRPLRSLRFSLVDVPDLQVLPAENPNITDIWMGAGPVPESLHRILNGLAKLRAALHLPAFTPFSKLFYTVLNLMKFGAHRGGMYVEALGTRNGQSATQSWHLLAEGDDGPYIPSMAIEAILRKWLAGNSPPCGARAATTALELSDYEALFEKRDIWTGWRHHDEAPAPIFKRVLGDAFETLPPQLKVLHGGEKHTVWRGEAETRYDKNILVRLIRKVTGIKAGLGTVPVTVTIDADSEAETWERSFDGKGFKSRLSPGTGCNKHLMMEKFGPLSVALSLEVKNHELHFVPRRWFILGCPMPNALLPRGTSFECEKNGMFYFDVEIRVPMAGLIAAYKGVLKPDCPPTRNP